MNLTAWRIVKAKYATSAFTGEGARLAGGRWNSSGIGMIYTAESISLATLELFVHLRNRKLMDQYVIFGVTFDTSLVSSVSIDTLPKSWRDFPLCQETQLLGDRWVKSEHSAVLKIPSVVTPSEFNYLLNPAHKDFGKLDIGSEIAMAFDNRLL